MQLTTKARYGLRALCHVAHRGYASAQVIADSQSIPSRYLEEIIGELRKAGLVVGKRGPRGGYRLAKEPAEIALSEILRALQTNSGQNTSGGPDDEITALVERSVDDQLQAAVNDMRLDQLLEQALDRHRRSAANYVI
jgi:Rrf2 family iron-sulfur cluster assembly transcriptional regulator